MTTQTAPVIPPRPTRSPQPPTSAFDMPKIPPRPTKHLDRSVSPMRDSYAPSPLNEWSGPSMTRTTSNDLPARPPSVTIPSLGEEGIEYADLDVGNMSDIHNQAPKETRNVSSDLKIHAPRPSLPSSSAKAKVQVVTRTDSRQAAAAGLGRDRPSRLLHSRASGSRTGSSPASSERRLSAQLGDDHGIRVPMYPNAGDVQAPSPSPYLDQGCQRPGRHHNRTRSGRDSSLPPGSYGLHGHGVQHADKFEKAWYEKHPDEYVKEEGQYGPGVGTPRPSWALSSDDLNKIVRGSTKPDSGLGTSPAMSGTPDEEVGYIASDEYTHRMVSPPLDTRHDSQPPVESPLRQMSFPAAAKQTPGSPSHHGRTCSHGHHGEGEVIHVDDPMHPLHHPDGFAPTPAVEEHTPETEDLPEEEPEPILASDEVRPESAYLHPAVSPTFDHRDSFDENRSRTPSVTHSRSNSRSADVSGGRPVLARWDSRELREDMHAPLEDVEEYEPLFPEDDKKDERPVSAAGRFKHRPNLLKHRFPSEDIWEDTPNSLQLHATVSTPDLPKRDSTEAFETPEQEAARRMQTSRVDPHQVATHILEGESAKASAFERPDYIKQRFPSRDIWEDTPDSQQLVTTVEPATAEAKSPDVPSKPSIPLRPQRQPQQTSPTEKRQPPLIPDRPKPQIPARPAKPSSQASTDDLTKVPSADASKEAPAVPKTKPAVPARPGGSKIAALKAGFLTDLNSRLQLGPQQQKPQEKKPDPPAEKPLSDARKGRARGPARRKPATENANARLPSIPEIKITETWNVWQVGEDGNLVVGSDIQAEKSPTSLDETTMAPPIARNVTGESVDPTPQSPAVEDVVSPDTVPYTAASSAETPEPVDPSSAPDEPAPSSETTAPAEAAQALADSIPPSKLDDALENMAASADGKHPSDGDVSHSD